jgi:uncharacterized membrane protein YkvA (DUF1232 family)
MWFRTEAATGQRAAALLSGVTGDERSLRREFWRKLKREAASLPYLEDVLTAHYCAFDRHTPFYVKAVLLGAIAYFVVPNNLMAKSLPLIGYADDAAIITAAVKVVTSHIKPEHREAARRALERMRGEA